jgi:hypothetical protein
MTVDVCIQREGNSQELKVRGLGLEQDFLHSRGMIQPATRYALDVNTGSEHGKNRRYQSRSTIRQDQSLCFALYPLQPPCALA